MITFLQFQPLQLSRLFVTLFRVVPFVVEGLRSRTTRRTCHSWRPLPIASGVCFWFRRHRACTKCRAGGRVCTYGLCRKCLCTRFEHAIHVLVALCHYARHCCSAVLSLYDRLCSLLSALLSLARGRVTRVFCIPFLFLSFHLFFRAVAYCCRCQTAPHLRQVHGEGRESHACLTSVHVVGSQSHSDSPRSSSTGSPRSLSVPSS